MTKRVLFVQGGGEGVHDQWDDKLVESLERELGEGYVVAIPRAVVRICERTNHQLNNDMSQVARDIRELAIGVALTQRPQEQTL